MSRRRHAAVLAVALAAGLAGPTRAAGRGEFGPVLVARVELADRKADLDLFRTLDLDVDGVFDGWARVHLVREELGKLERLGYRVTLLPAERPETAAAPAGPGQFAIPAAYHTYATLTSELAAIAAARPDLVRLQSLGPTVQGRALWMVKITANPDVEEDEPEVAFVAAMHGDEVVGKELCIELIHYLLDRYGTDPRVTDLVDGSEIWILPSMNPDGTELVQRYNANGYDLNRNFPDWFQDPVNTPAGRQPETQAVMAWVAAEGIDLSANFHGGALVANYPFDNNATGASVFTPTPAPDHAAFLSLALTYSENNPPMYASPTFPNGVTNGADWYTILGGMQDWGYTWYGKFDLTLEISNVKWPAAIQLPTFWNENRESMLSFFERAQEGLRGIVTDAASGAPLAAEIRLGTDPFAVHTDPQVGDYHRIVLAGGYSMQVSAPGYEPQTIPVTVAAGPAARYDVALVPLPTWLEPIATAIDDGPGGDGRIDAGETVDLAVTLKNLGAAATSVGGRLIPAAWHSQVLQDLSAYPDLGGQESAEGAIPYTIRADPAAPAGHRLGFAVDWHTTGASGVSEPFYLALGGSTCASTAATDVPKSILDYQTATSQLPLAADSVIDDVRVTVHVTHTYIGDLELTLHAPSGSTVRLHDRTGGSANDIVGTYGVNLTPDEPLSLLDGQTSSGTWSLVIRDLAGGDVGTLDSWSLEVCGSPVETATPAILLRSVGREPGAVRLRWWHYPGLQSYKVYRSTDATFAAAFLDVTAEDGDATDDEFLDASTDPIVFYLVSGVGPLGEGPKGHSGE